MKKGKAGGVCEISGELLKAGGEVVIKWMTVIYSLVWRTGVAPMGLAKSNHCASP